MEFWLIFFFKACRVLLAGRETLGHQRKVHFIITEVLVSDRHDLWSVKERERKVETECHGFCFLVFFIYLFFFYGEGFFF